MQERRANPNFEQTVLLELGNIKALVATTQAEGVATSNRVTSLEKTNTRQWWLHGIQTLLLGALGFARKAGLL